jgi:hypothetical protein
MPLSHPQFDTDEVIINNTNEVFNFNSLPAELRLKIWEETWPEPRAIEVADLYDPQSPDLDGAESAESDESDESDDSDEIQYNNLCLRATCRLARWVSEDLGGRVVEEDPLEDCRDPVAIQVNRESRYHTLSRYVLICHPKLTPATFYCDPRSDILCLTVDVDKVYLRDLRALYGTQLDMFKTILFNCSHWDECQLTWDLLDFFGGISEVRVLLDSSDPEDNPPVEEEVDSTNSSPVVYERDTRLPAERKWILQYIDRQQNVYNEADA